MKLLFTLLLSVLCLSVQAQISPFDYKLTFEKADTLCHKKIILDTTHSNNIWQIGNPNKTIFKTGYYDSNALVTDTLNSYPPNDTSIFYVKMPLEEYGARHMWYLGEVTFNYRLDIDTGEIAKVEMSIDSGQHWLDVLRDSLPYYAYTTPKDSTCLSYSTAFWSGMTLYIDLMASFPIADTMTLKFTFISDSVDTHKDGWMIDNFAINYWTEAVPQLTKNNNLIKVYPNPSNGNITLSTTQQVTHPGTVTVYNSVGQQVFEKKDVSPNSTLHLPLPDGTYVLKYTTDKEYAVKQVVISR